MEDEEKQIRNIASHFSAAGEFAGWEPIKSGHINSTFEVNFETLTGGKDYLLQMINTEVFKEPDKLMKNVASVTDFIRKKTTEAGLDPETHTMYIIPTTDGQTYFRDAGGKCWRMYNYVPNSYSCDSVSSPEVFYNAAVAFGNFQKMLADFPSETLYETIPHFHDTGKRYKDFLEAVERDAVGRAAGAREEIEFVKSRKWDTDVLTSMIASGKLPLRVTHNDTKLNNVLFDRNTHEGICVVDLDTVMPGLSLYDFGDSIRFGANTAAEDEKDLTRVSLDTELYRQYVRGYLSTAGSSLVPAEVEYMPFSAKIMTFECGMRFLADYINGDTYFRIDYPEHNMDRCRTQFALVRDIENKFDEMNSITQEAYSRICAAKPKE